MMYVLTAAAILGAGWSFRGQQKKNAKEAAAGVSALIPEVSVLSARDRAEDLRQLVHRSSHTALYFGGASAVIAPTALRRDCAGTGPPSPFEGDFMRRRAAAICAPPRRVTTLRYPDPLSRSATPLAASSHRQVRGTPRAVTSPRSSHRRSTAASVPHPQSRRQPAAREQPASSPHPQHDLCRVPFSAGALRGCSAVFIPLRARELFATIDALDDEAARRAHCRRHGLHALEPGPRSAPRPEEAHRQRLLSDLGVETIPRYLLPGRGLGGSSVAATSWPRGEGRGHC